MNKNFLAKKSWHTQTIKNVERVWKAEQEAEREKRRVAEIQKQLKKEQENRELYESRHGKAAVDRLDWMYRDAAALKQESAEDYLMGKKKLETKEEEKEDLTTPALLQTKEVTQAASAYEDWAKTQEDPMLAIARQEKQQLDLIRSNPLIMKRLREKLMQEDMKDQEKKKRKREKKEKKEKKEEKKRKKERTEGESSERTHSHESHTHRDYDNGKARTDEIERNQKDYNKDNSRNYQRDVKRDHDRTEEREHHSRDNRDDRKGPYSNHHSGSHHREDRGGRSDRRDRDDRDDRDDRRDRDRNEKKYRHDREEHYKDNRNGRGAERESNASKRNGNGEDRHDKKDPISESQKKESSQNGAKPSSYGLSNVKEEVRQETGAVSSATEDARKKAEEKEIARNKEIEEKLKKRNDVRRARLYGHKKPELTEEEKQKRLDDMKKNASKLAEIQQNKISALEDKLKSLEETEDPKHEMNPKFLKNIRDDVYLNASDELEDRMNRNRHYRQKGNLDEKGIV